MSLATIEAKIEADVAAFEAWMTTDAKKVVTALKPLINSIVAAGKADIVADVETDIPSVAAALLTGGEVAALTTAGAEITTQLATQGKQLEQTAITGLAATAVAAAKASAASSASGSSGTASATTAQAS